MNHIIGIDFGTTKTLVSWINPKTNQAELVRLGQQGTDKIPTSVYIGENGDFLFGEDADDQMQFDAVRYKRAFKLQLGSTSPAMIVKLDGKNQRFLARDLTSKFLEYIKNRCEQEVFLGEKISGVVITIPVSFSPAQKQDLEKAAKNAGYSDVVLLPEPEAAGLAFANYNPTDKFKSMMIVDWGGGTVDFAMVSKNANGEIHANADSFDGDETLGGEVFDELLWQHAVEKIIETDSKGRDPNEEPLEIINAMIKQVRLCKERLSKSTQTRLVLAGAMGAYSTNIQQNEFSDLISESVDGIAMKLQQLLRKIYLRENALPEALLMIGGSSSIPAIQRILTAKSGLKCISWQYAHEAVALGAALYTPNILASQTENHSSDSSVLGCPVCYQKLRAPSGQNKLRCPKCAAEFIVPASSMPSLVELVNNPAKLESVQKAAAEDNPVAESLLGILYSDGLIADLNFEEGYKYSKKAADAGDFFASFYLAMDLYEGRGVQQNKKKAKEIFSKIYDSLNIGAKKGNPLAQYALGYMYSNGIVVTEDDQIAYQWYAESAKNNNLQAMQALSDCYLNGDGVEKNMDLAYKLIKEAADKGLHTAYGGLANCYLQGEGVNKDTETAIYFCRKAVEHGVYYASFIICAQYLQNGETEKANDYFKPYLKQLIHDADNGEQNCQLFLGFAYELGVGVEIDLHKAFNWYAKSAAQNCPEAMVKTAQCYLIGQGTTANEDLGFKILKSKELKDNSEAEFWLSICYAGGLGTNCDAKEATRYLKKSANAHCEDAIILLGKNYLSGNNVPKNEKEAVRLFSEIVAENAEASYWLGICYRDGLGVSKSEQKAIELFKKSVSQNNTDAMVALANCYVSGSGVEENQYRAFELFSRSTEQENAQGILSLGYCYASGVGTSSNDTEAKKCFSKAAELGNGEAISALFTRYGICYSEKENELVNSMLQIISRFSFLNSNLYPKNKIPYDKLSNAIAKYAIGISRQHCLALFDDTVFGAGDDGFLITYAGFLGHNFADDNVIAFGWTDIEKVEYSGNGTIVVNGCSVSVSDKAQQLAQMILDLRACFINHFLSYEGN